MGGYCKETLENRGVYSYHMSVHLFDPGVQFPRADMKFRWAAILTMTMTPRSMLSLGFVHFGSAFCLAFMLEFRILVISTMAFRASGFKMHQQCRRDRRARKYLLCNVSM